MGLVNLKEMAKRAKRTEEEIEQLVECKAIRPPAYCRPGEFGDGREIAFYPEKVLAQIKAKKTEPKVVVKEEETVGEPEIEGEEPKEEPKGKGKTKTKK